MSRKKYFVASFPSTSMKNALAYLSGHVLGVIDRIHKMFRTYAEESYDQTPRWILYNVLKNNEAIFSIGTHDVNSGASTSHQGQSSQHSSSPLKEDTSSSCLAQQLPVGDETNLETESTSRDKQESVKVCEDAQLLKNPESDKMDIATTSKDAEINPREEKRKIMESEEDLNNLLKENLIQIKSISVIRQSKLVGVEIDFDSSGTFQSSPKKKREQDSSPWKKTKNPGSSGKGGKSPVISPLKLMKSTTGEFHQDIDYSDPIILEFLSQRLLLILLQRKTCMEQIYDCFQKFLREARFYKITINNLKFVLSNIPMEAESYNTDDFKQLRDSLINKADSLLKKAVPLEKDLEKDTKVLEDCNRDIDSFQKEYLPHLSTKGEYISNIDDLRKIEKRLKEICKKADIAVFLEDERRAVLIDSWSGFEWFLKYFVKFLIMTEILKPTESA